jgi:hypothetical protein
MFSAKLEVHHQNFLGICTYYVAGNYTTYYNIINIINKKTKTKHYWKTIQKKNNSIPASQRFLLVCTYSPYLGMKWYYMNNQNYLIRNAVPFFFFLAF